MNAVAISKMTAACLTVSSAADRTAFLERQGFVAVVANNGTMKEFKEQQVDR